MAPADNRLSDLEAAIKSRDAAHAAWLSAASPPAPPTVLVSDDKSLSVHAAWDLWAAACRRVADLEMGLAAGE